MARVPRNARFTTKRLRKPARVKRALANGLSPRHQRFVDSYIANGGNATKAALAAGFSEANPGVSGCVLLKRPDIRIEIDKRREEVFKGRFASPERVVRELEAIAFSDITEAVGIKTVNDLKKLPADVRRAIQLIKKKKGSLTIDEIKMLPKHPALELLAKMMGMVQEPALGKDGEISRGVTFDDLRNLMRRADDNTVEIQGTRVQEPGSEPQALTPVTPTAGALDRLLGDRS